MNIRNLQNGVLDKNVSVRTYTVPDIGATEANGQAGTIWTCPECGFKSISRDEYDVHNNKHGIIYELRMSLGNRWCVKCNL